MKKQLLFFFLVCFIGTCAFAQDENQSRRKFEEIGFLAGQWNVSVEARLSAQGPWETSQGRSQITRIVGSTVLDENFSGTRQGKQFYTKTLFAFNNQTLKYQRVFVDSEHGSLIDFEGQKSADSLIFDRTWTYSHGASVQLRVVYVFISPDEFKVENMRKPERTSSWDVTGRMTYTRAQ